MNLKTEDQLPRGIETAADAGATDDFRAALLAVAASFGGPDVDPATVHETTAGRMAPAVGGAALGLQLSMDTRW